VDGRPVDGAAMAGMTAEAGPAGVAAVDDEFLPAPVRRALAAQPVQHEIDVAGARVAYLAWGQPSNPPLIFVHGGAAHSWWWSSVAPLFADRFRVVALDLFGHGESDRVEEYSFLRWADQIRSVAAEVGPMPPVVIGHSMGGLATAVAAATGGLAGALIVDAPVGAPSSTTVGEADATLARPKLYPSRAVAVSRFRPLPDQRGYLRPLLRFIGERSVRADADGWGWKFDFRIFSHPPADRPHDLLATLAAGRCPIGIVMGAESEVVPSHDRSDLGALAHDPKNPVVSSIEIDGGGHHLMFDKPVELYLALNRTLELLSRRVGG